MENLKKLRTKHNLSQQKLADILHISQQSIYKYENDITSPDLETLKSMADFFNTSIDCIIGYSAVPHKIELVTETMLNHTELNLIQQYRRLNSYHKSIIRIRYLPCTKQLKVSSKDKFGEAVSYALNQERYLRVFLTDGDVPMDK